MVDTTNARDTAKTGDSTVTAPAAIPPRANIRKTWWATDPAGNRSTPADPQAAPDKA
jgi:hypothetical protein